MARIILTATVVVLMNVLVGCRGIDSGRGQIMPARTSTALGSAPRVRVAGARESDIVEQIAVHRQAYRQGLEALVEYYTKAGDNMKLNWAGKELRALNAIPQYNYIIEAQAQGPRLKATTSIAEADYLYSDALRMEKQAGQLMVVKNDNLLRLALDKYNQLIRKYPSSDKIDDAAFHAAAIYEHFKDYTIAVLYYQRTYQWDPETIYPAKFKAAFVLDRFLHRRAEALQLYEQALEQIQRAGQHREWQEFAEKRVRELRGLDEQQK